MKPAPFEYHRVERTEDAIARLAELGDEAKVLAGGQSLVPMMNFRLVRPPALVDITRIPDLRYVERDGDRLRIGALTMHREVEQLDDPAVVDGYELLPRGCALGRPLSDPHARHVRGLRRARRPFGRVVHARRAPGRDDRRHRPGRRARDPGGGVLPRLLHDRARARRAARRGPPPAAAPPRRAAGVRPPPRRLRHRRSRGRGRLDGDRMADARIVIGGVDEVPLRIEEAERVLEGAAPGGEAFAEAGRVAAAAVDPSADVHGSAEYRRELTAVLVRRALAEAIHTDAGATAMAAGDGRLPVTDAEAAANGGRWVGRPIRRVEDARHLTGTASFVDDIRRPGVLSIAVARSPHGRRAHRRDRHRRRAARPRRVRARLTADDLGDVRAARPAPRPPRVRRPSRCRCSRATASATWASRSRRRRRDAARRRGRRRAGRVDVRVRAGGDVDRGRARRRRPAVHDEGNVLLDVAFHDDPELDDRARRRRARARGDLRLRAPDRRPDGGPRLPGRVGRPRPAAHAVDLDAGATSGSHDGRRGPLGIPEHRLRVVAPTSAAASARNASSRARRRSVRRRAPPRRAR